VAAPPSVGTWPVAGDDTALLDAAADCPEPRGAVSVVPGVNDRRDNWEGSRTPVPSNAGAGDGALAVLTLAWEGGAAMPGWRPERGGSSGGLAPPSRRLNMLSSGVTGLART
jgi:hypothetical protein